MCGSAPAVGQPDSNKDSIILHQYYSDRDYFTSPEGIMKVVSVIICIVLSVILFYVSCMGESLLLASAAVELVCAALLACLYATRLLQLPLYAPMGFLLVDLILSTVIGILLLVMAVLSLTLCDLVFVRDYIHGPLGIANAGIVTGSAVITYVTVTRRWDAVYTVRAPGCSRPTELDV